MNYAPSAIRNCEECPIRNRAVCAQCAPAELLQLESIKFYRTYDPRQPVLWSGDEMGFVASVVSGVATLGQTLADGRVAMVGLLLPSDIIGRPGRSTALYDVTAASELTLCCFRRRPFERMMAEMPHVAQRVLETTLDEVDAARTWAAVLGRRTAREKVASLLAILARREAALQQTSPRDGLQFDLPLTREAIADYLGLTLETVSRQFSALRRAGVIVLESRRTVRVPRIAALLDAAGGVMEATPI